MTILIHVLVHATNTPLFYAITMEYVDTDLLSSNEIDGTKMVIILLPS
jgi:hypothetical protein